MTSPAYAIQPPDAPSGSVFQSALFMPPGRSRPIARRLAIHNRAVRRIRRFLEENRFQEIPVPTGSGTSTLHHLDAMIELGFPAVWCESQSLSPDRAVGQRHLSSFKLIEAVGLDLDLPALCDLMEKLLKAVAGDLGADILGGRAVTRIDRMIGRSHPRMPYAEALAVLNRRGWSLTCGAELDPEAEASLLRYCGNLPVLLTHRPGPVKPGVAAGPDDTAERVQYLLPYAGEVMDGGVRAGQTPRAGFGLGVARMLQFLMGLGSITDAVIRPIGQGSQP